MRVTRNLAVLLGLTAAAAAPARAAEGVAACEVIATSETVAIVWCPKLLDEAGWKEAGTAACKGKPQCNAWFWLDRAVAPKTAPKTDADMPKSVSGEARAVWVNDSQKLILLRKAP